MQDNIIIITGATSGIGKALAARCAAAGAKLGLIARNSERLDAVATELRGTGATVAVASADVCDERAVQAAMDSLRSALGPIDILVNNAGVGFGTVIAETSLEDFRTMVDTNLTGVFLCAKAVLPGMLERGEGHICNVSSVVGKVANPGAPIYCASKHGLNGLVSGLRQQVGPKGVKVSMVSPSAADTAYWDGREVDRSKFLQADEVAEAIEFILTRPRGVLILDMDLTAYRS